jgi:hypothetical protein
MRYADRPKDGLTLMVDVGVTANEREARELEPDAMGATGIVKEPMVSPSGKVIGQSSTMLCGKTSSRQPAGSLKLVARDGLSVVTITMLYPAGGPPKPFTKADLALAEELPRHILARLTAMGYTNSPASTATPEIRKEVEERAKKLAEIDAQKPPSEN